MSFESIHNYYEQLVLARINELRNKELKDTETDLLCDIACVALNQLPSRYVRHNVDMIFYMPAQERTKIDHEVASAVEKAIEYVMQHNADH
ncbi:MAG: late competence development ComFB family protein [Gammaproteobacteria bacterium]|nr:late competence development ComFB family protein [Gammaproteobacteria bacterium]